MTKHDKEFIIFLKPTEPDKLLVNTDESCGSGSSKGLSCNKKGK